MSNSNTFKMLKEVIYCIYDANGNERVNCIGIVRENDVSEVRKELLKNIIKICLESDWFSMETKLYLKNRDMTLKRVNEYINEMIISEREEYVNKYGLKLGKDNKINYNNTVSKIMYDQKRLNAKFGGDFMANIVNQKTVDISNYELVVGKLLVDLFSKESIRDRLAIKIKDNIVIKEYDGDFIEKYGDILSFYLKSTLKAVEDKLNNDKFFCGYFNYLLSGISTNDLKVIEDRNKLSNLLKLDMSDLIMERLENGVHLEEIIIKEETKNKKEKVDNINTSGENEDTLDIRKAFSEVIQEYNENSEEPDKIDNNDRSKTLDFDKFNIVPQNKKEELDEIEENEEILELTSDENENTGENWEDGLEIEEELDFDNKDTDEDDLISFNDYIDKYINNKDNEECKQTSEEELNNDKKEEDTNTKAESTIKEKLDIDKKSTNNTELKKTFLQF